MFLTHLHFDHCGGSTVLNSNNVSVPLLKMPNIGQTKIIGLGNKPKLKRKSFFLKENLIPIEESGQLCFLDVKSPGFNHYDELGLMCCLLTDTLKNK